MTYEEIRTNAEIEALINKGNNNLGNLGYTEHGKAHGTLVAQRAAYVLEQLGFSEHDKELARIAGYMPDIGNAINRSHHAEYGALLANSILEKTDISLEDRITIMSAIGNHDESTGGAMDPVSAALIIADKTDVRRSRVREQQKSTFDIHDRVNYAVTKSSLIYSNENKAFTLDLKLDTDICTMYEYFEIFLNRMMMCRGAADLLGVKFELTANGSKIL